MFTRSRSSLHLSPRSRFDDCVGEDSMPMSMTEANPSADIPTSKAIEGDTLLGAKPAKEREPPTPSKGLLYCKARHLPHRVVLGELHKGCKGLPRAKPSVPQRSLAAECLIE